MQSKRSGVRKLRRASANQYVVPQNSLSVKGRYLASAFV
jgi:hypothetical protein